MSFENALAYVHDTLRGMHALGAHPTAPLSALETLRLMKPSPVAREKAPSPPPATAPRPKPALPKLPPLPPPAGDLASLRAAAPEGLARVAHPHIIFGTGAPRAEVLFITDAPGEEDSLEDDPLESAAGVILKGMIKAMDYALEEVYVAYVLRDPASKRTRTSEHRQPTAAERQEGLQRLQQIIALVQPRVIVALGASVVEGLLGVTEPIGKIRSQWLDFRGTPLLPTYSPAYLARNQSNSKKREVWTDMLLVLERLGRPISEKQRGFFLSK